VSSTRYRAAASMALRRVPDGRSGRVLGVFPGAVYVELGPELLALEASDALRLPCAVVLPVPTSARPFARLRPGMSVTTTGSGRLVLGHVTVDIVRWWRPRRARTIDTYDAARLSVLAATLPPLTPPVGDRLSDLVRDLEPGGDLAGATARLLGLGAGLTPEGDDVLAGLLVALRSRPGTEGMAERLGDAVTTLARGHTTNISIALLRHAVAGHATPWLLDVIDALSTGRRHDELPAAVVRLLAVGHTSGAALAHGVLAAARMHTAPRVRSEVA
jgi:uncharacterized protein DUF2877